MNQSNNEKDFIYRMIGDERIGINIQKKQSKYDITFSQPIKWLEDHHDEGVIVAKNPITDAWVGLMILNDEDLGPYTGLTLVSDYRKQMIYSICELWD